MPVVNVKVVMEVLDGVCPEPIIEQLGIDEFNYPGLVEVAASATETIDFSGPATVSFLFIRFSRGYTFNIDSTGAVTMNAGGWVLLFNASLTSLVVINTDSINAGNLEVILGGT